MGTQITITGTGTPLPSPSTAGPGVLIRHGDLALMFDAGRGTVGRLVDAGLAPRRVDTLFVTHHHSDHLLGVVDLVMTRWLSDQQSHEPLEIVAPSGPAVTFVENMLMPWQADIDVRMDHTHRPDRPDPEIADFTPSPTATEIWSRGDIRVLAQMVHHEPVTPAMGYRVETPDGVIVISGDTRVCDEIGELSIGASLVVHEACRSEVLLARRDIAPQVEQIVEYHADTFALGALAKQYGMNHLLLTHLIPPPTNDEQRQGFIDDVRSAGFTGQLTVAQDLTTITLGV